jgi:hypothetical protein
VALAVATTDFFGHPETLQDDLSPAGDTYQSAIDVP